MHFINHASNSLSKSFQYLDKLNIEIPFVLVHNDHAYNRNTVLSYLYQILTSSGKGAKNLYSINPHFHCLTPKIIFPSWNVSFYKHLWFAFLSENATKKRTKFIVFRQKYFVSDSVSTSPLKFLRIGKNLRKVCRLLLRVYTPASISTQMTTHGKTSLS